MTDPIAPRRVVWKYDLGPGPTVLTMPRDAKVLHVDTQGTNVCLWALVEPDQPARDRTFLVVGTGHELPSEVFPPAHVGTFLTDERGTFVFHVFESMDEKLISAMERGAEHG